MKNHNEFFSGNQIPEKRAKFNRIKKTVELESRQGDKPTIEISDFGLLELSSLEKKIEEIAADSGPGLVAVMRGWNLDSRDLEDIVTRINKIKNNISALKGMFFVINGDEEKGDLTEKSLWEIIKSGKTELPIVPIKIHNYTWTAGLNLAVAITNEIALNKNVDRDKLKILNISYGVDLEESELIKCKNAIVDARFVITVRNTDSQEDSVGETDPALLWEKFKQLLKNPKNADLGYALRSMRNTFNILPLSDIVKYGGFNPATVPLGGMEDADFLMRMILDALKSGDIETIKQFKKAMTSPIAYSDKRWLELKNQKDANEATALEKVLSGLAINKDLSDNGYRIAENNQDFRIKK